MAVILPDGRDRLARGPGRHRRPFVPLTIDEMRRVALGRPRIRHVPGPPDATHYLVFYQGSRSSPRPSAELLERLHDGLTGTLKKNGLPVAPIEFPLVAVIFATEDEFRASRRVAPEVQAYYEILSNRIYFYEKSRRDQESPEVSALRKPQTVAHEGTHQILHNVGLQPRLSDWPLWLVEGLAEYCSPPKVTKKGASTGPGSARPTRSTWPRSATSTTPCPTQIRGATGGASPPGTGASRWSSTSSPRKS